MITREKALKLLRKYIKTENTIKHMLACEVIMRALANYFLDKGDIKPDEGATRAELVEAWAMAGLLHDIDYETIDPQTKQGHGKVSVEILKKEKADVTQPVLDTIHAHCFNLYPEFKPKNNMEWSLFICDSLTGLIVAVTLVRPEKKLAVVEVKNIQKKFKEKSFASGTRREEITLCEEKLGIPLPEFIDLSLKAMQGISSELGL